MIRRSAHTLLLLLALLAGCPAGGDPPQLADPCDGTPTLTADGAALTFDLPGCSSVSLTGEPRGEGELTLSWRLDGGAATPLIGGTGTFEGLVLRGDATLAGEEEPRWWRQGYQSWSWAGVVDLEPLELAEGVPTAGGDGDGNTVLWETPATSWWVGLLGRPDGASVLLGALDASRTKFYAAAGTDELFAVWGTRGERIAVADGGELALDPLWIEVGRDAAGLHRSYADAVVAHRSLAPPLGTAPTGWASWYYFYADVREVDVRANLQRASELASDETLGPMEVFQIDDGWEVVWGDWTANDQFPSGMADLAADIRDEGFTPGLWMAPFYVDRSTDTYQLHADWWVRDSDGVEIVFTNQSTGDYAIIDATHPDAGAWMAQQIADKVADGWLYLKLDFLYAGAQEGQRYQEVSGVEAYRIAMELLREAAGPAWVLACGAPMLPSVGYFDSFRTGADIAFGSFPDPDPAFLRWQARATAARSWSNGAWWWIDPDQLLVRDPFDDDQARGSVVAQAASGGAWFLGDDLPSLPDERLAMALNSEAVALRGQPATPARALDHPSGFDPGPLGELAIPDDQVPTRWKVGDDHVLLLNLGEVKRELACPGGVELLTGASCEPGDNRTLAAGGGEIWRTMDP